MSKLLVFDTETNKIPVWDRPSGGKMQPHIVQLAALQVDVDTRKITGSMEVIIKPDGWRTDEAKEAFDAHRITNEVAHDVGIPEKLAVEMLLALAMQPDTLRVAFNRPFDQRIIRIAIKRYWPGDTDLEEEWGDKDTSFCAMVNSRLIVEVPNVGKRGFKQPSLAEAYQHFTGTELVDAHNAMADTKAALTVYWGIQDFENPPEIQAPATESLPLDDSPRAFKGENF